MLKNMSIFMHNINSRISNCLLNISHLTVKSVKKIYYVKNDTEISETLRDETK